MANAGIEATLKKIADTQLVIGRLMETHERQWNKRFENLQGLVKNHEGRTEDLERGAENLRRVAETHERRLDDGADRTAALQDEVRTMVASVDRLIKTIEDMAKGRKRENGRRK